MLGNTAEAEAPKPYLGSDLSRSLAYRVPLGTLLSLSVLLLRLIRVLPQRAGTWEPRAQLQPLLTVCSAGCLSYETFRDVRHTQSITFTVCPTQGLGKRRRVAGVGYAIPAIMILPHHQAGGWEAHCVETLLFEPVGQTSRGHRQAGGAVRHCQTLLVASSWMHGGVFLPPDSNTRLGSSPWCT